ncbi:MAG: PAS domain-containing protein [Candidatus Levybacteria bacterium]|nr:PAS domain-containing protein [Candidatus Levybacteria bacterium]MBI2420733.1 PAS domain-containing protein [Candidatus Levybacteria bacterium]
MFREIADSVPAMIAVYNIKTEEYVYVNRAIKKLLGYTPSDFTKKGLKFVSSLVHPDDMSRLLLENSKALREANKKRHSSDRNPIVSFEYRMKHKNGTYRWLHTDGSVFFRDEKGKVESVLNASLDITGRKEIEEKYKKIAEELEERIAERTKTLEQSEKKFRALVEKSWEVVALVDRSAKILYATPSMIRLFGRDYKEFLGMSGIKFIHPFDVPLVLKTLARLILKPKSSETLELRVRHKDGSYKWIEATGTNLLNEPEVGAIVVNFRDITERRKAAEELLESEERLRIATEAGQIGIWDWDIVNNRITWSDRLFEIYGISKEDFSGTVEEYLKTIHPQDVKYVNSLIKKCLEGKAEYKVEYRAFGKGGSLIWISAQAKVIFDSKGKPLRMLGACFDITARKEQEQRKDDFIALASHELKTPVTSLKLFTQSLNKRFKKQKDHELGGYLSAMDRQIGKLVNLIDDLLDVSHVRSGKTNYKMEQFSFSDLAREVSQNIGSIAKKHKIIIKDRSKSDVVADKERISQVLTNLINNAIKYSPKSNKVIVSFEKDTRSLIVSVRDFGIGISEDDQERVFDRFFQAANPKRNTFSGLGLGLYISKEIIDRHGGKIWLESKEGKGSTFYFTIPNKRN